MFKHIHELHIAWEIHIQSDKSIRQKNDPSGITLDIKFMMLLRYSFVFL